MLVPNQKGCLIPANTGHLPPLAANTGHLPPLAANNGHQPPLACKYRASNPAKSTSPPVRGRCAGVVVCLAFINPVIKQNPGVLAVAVGLAAVISCENKRGNTMLVILLQGAGYIETGPGCIVAGLFFRACGSSFEISLIVGTVSVLITQLPHRLGFVHNRRSVAIYLPRETETHLAIIHTPGRLTVAGKVGRQLCAG